MKLIKKSTTLCALLIALISISCTHQVSQNQNTTLSNVEIIDITSLDPGSYKTIGKGRIYDTEYSPDNKILAVGTSAGVIFYETTKYDEIKTIPSSFVDKLEWSPDGRYIAVAETSKLFIYDFTSKKVIDLEYSNDVLNTEQISWSPNSHYLAATTLLALHGNAWIWDISTGKRIYDFGLNKRKFSSSAYANGLGWSSNNLELAISFRIVNTNEVDEESQLIVLDFSNNQRPKVKSRWSIPNYLFTREFTLPEQSTGNIYWVDNDKYLVVISSNNVSILTTSNGKVTKQLVSKETIQSEHIQDEKLLLVTGEKNLSLLTFSIPDLIKTDDVFYSKNPLCTPQQMKFNHCAFENVSISPDASLIAASSSFHDGIFIWKSEKDQIATSIYLDSHWNNDLAFSLDGKFVATLGQDGFVRSYDIDTLQAIDIVSKNTAFYLTDNGAITNHQNNRSSTRLILNGNYPTEDIQIQSPNQQMNARLEKVETTCSWLECGGDSVYKLTVQDIESNNTIFSLQLTGRTSLELQWSPDSKWLLTNGSIGNKDYALPFGLIIMAVESPHKTIVLSSIGPIKGIDWSKDGRYIGTTGYNGLIRIINAEKIVATFFEKP